MPRSTIAPAIVAALVMLTQAAFAADPDAGTPVFGTPKNLPQSAGFGEPGIATAPDGTLYVTAPGSASALWRSDDDGDHWMRVANSLGSSGDSDVAIDANGVVYVSDLFSNVPVSTSFDRGASFAYEAATANGGSNDRQWLAASGNGHVFSVWRDGSTERIAVSHDQGVSWTRHVVASGVGLQGNIVAVDDTTLLIPFSGNGGINLARSTNAGASWAIRNVHPDGSTTLFPAVAADRAGSVYVTWIGYDGLDRGYSIHLAVSNNGGQTFSANRVLASGHTSVFPWIVAGDEGNVAVAWYDTSVIDGITLPPDAAASAKWVVKVAYANDAHLGHGASWSVTQATGVFHTGPICTMGTGCFPVANPIYGNRALLDFFEMAETNDGDIIITYAADQAVVSAGQTILKVVKQTAGPNLRD